MQVTLERSILFQPPAAAIRMCVTWRTLGSGPALAIDFEDAMHLPRGAIGHQDLTWVSIPLAFPEHDDSHRVRDAGNADTFGKVPLLFAISRRFAPTQRPQCTLHPRTGFPVFPIDRDGAAIAGVLNRLHPRGGPGADEAGRYCGRVFVSAPPEMQPTPPLTGPSSTRT